MNLNVTPKRTDLTLLQKKEIKSFFEENSNLTHSMIAAHFTAKWNIRVVRSTVSGILRSDNIDCSSFGRSPGAKRLKRVEYPHLEECLYLYFCNVRA